MTADADLLQLRLTVAALVEHRAAEARSLIAVECQGARARAEAALEFAARSIAQKRRRWLERGRR